MVPIENIGGFIQFNFNSIDWDAFDVRGKIIRIKDAVPSDKRDYDEATGIWTVDDEYQNRVEDILLC